MIVYTRTLCKNSFTCSGVRSCCTCQIACASVFAPPHTPTQIGRSVLAPPNVPAARVAVLRAAFQKAVKDKDFLAGAEKVSLPVRAASGDEIQAAVQKVLGSSPELVKRVKDVLDAN